MTTEITKQEMITNIEYTIAHTEWDTSYRVVRIWDVLQYIKDNDDSFCDIQDIPASREIFELRRNYWYTISDQSEECIRFIYNLCK